MNNLPMASPFKTAYLIVFVFAIWDLYSEAIAKFQTSAHKAFAPEALGLSMTFLWIFLCIAAFAFALHLFRIYISLGVMEEDDQIFEEFLVDLSPTKRFFEFWIRVGVVFVISLKFTPLGGVTDIKKLGLMLVSVYGAMLVWDIVMWIYRRKPAWQFFLTSIVGFGGGGALVWMAWDEKREIEWVMGEAFLLFIIGLVIAVLVISDLYKHRKTYCAYLSRIFGFVG